MTLHAPRGPFSHTPLSLALPRAQEWTAEEIAQGLHTPSMRFAIESRSQRGQKAALVYSKSLTAKEGKEASVHTTPSTTASEEGQAPARV